MGGETIAARAGAKRKRAVARRRGLSRRSGSSKSSIGVRRCWPFVHRAISSRDCDRRDPGWQSECAWQRELVTRAPRVGQAGTQSRSRERYCLRGAPLSSANCVRSMYSISLFVWCEPDVSKVCLTRVSSTSRRARWRSESNCRGLIALRFRPAILPRTRTPSPTARLAVSSECKSVCARYRSSVSGAMNNGSHCGEL